MRLTTSSKRTGYRGRRLEAVVLWILRAGGCEELHAIPEWVKRIEAIESGERFIVDNLDACCFETHPQSREVRHEEGWVRLACRPEVFLNAEMDAGGVGFEPSTTAEAPPGDYQPKPIRSRHQADNHNPTRHDVETGKVSTEVHATLRGR